MRTCSSWCRPCVDDPACRMCRLAPVESSAGSGAREEKIRDVLFAVLAEVRFYRSEVEASTDLPFSFRVHDARVELMEALDVMRFWARGHMETVGRGLS